MEYLYEYFLEIVECKFARNGLTNWKTSLANILKNIIFLLFGIFLLVNPIKLWKSLYPNVHTQYGEVGVHKRVWNHYREPGVYC